MLEKMSNLRLLVALHSPDKEQPTVLELQVGTRSGGGCCAWKQKEKGQG